MKHTSISTVYGFRHICTDICEYLHIYAHKHTSISTVPLPYLERRNESGVFAQVVAERDGRDLRPPGRFASPLGRVDMLGANVALFINYVHLHILTHPYQLLCPYLSPCRPVWAWSTATRLCCLTETHAMPSQWSVGGGKRQQGMPPMATERTPRKTAMKVERWTTEATMTVRRKVKVRRWRQSTTQGEEEEGKEQLWTPPAWPRRVSL